MTIRKIALTSAAALLAVTAMPAAARPDTPEATPVASAEADATLIALYEDYSRWVDDEFGNGLPSVTPETHTANLAKVSGFLARLDAIDPALLSDDERVNAAVLRSVLVEQIEDARYREWEMPFDSDSNFWSYLAPRGGFQSVEEYQNHISRMRDIPRYFAEHTDNARAGLERGFSVPRVTLEGRADSLIPFTSEDMGVNPFWAAFENIPGNIPESERDRLRKEGEAAILEAVVPAYQALFTFLTQDYFPHSRETLAAHAMPDGEAYYAQQIRQYTTLDLSADEIHQIGLGEVARIEAAMREIMAEVGFEGSIAEFNESLRTDPRFIAKTPDELMGVSAYVAKRVDGEMGKYFGFLPRHRFSIRPVAPEIAPFYTAGRGGYEYCQMNTYDLPSRPLYNIPALTLHECAPGHSFQAAFQREQGGDDIPAFRRRIYFSGMGEGWGLYAEFLGEEMGIYRTPYEKFGRLSYEMWRAARLVIDTGIHSQGWSRDRAVSYLGDRTALSRHEVGTEIDRYISWPGQALAYKLGEMQIRRLRIKAEQELGEKFDIRKFHDVILALGSVPLPVLEQRIEAFIADGGQGLNGVGYE
ncbi:DUF885 domain-containing protein [Pontixanthobacter aquaemixtae]|uniref:DUF885 family protein n=1 Tax=Pontixanthobacter aquaemixtae TaxID=1958940 RepID=A0A844ZU65_9SPHN|nr:DUF885 family protein [Pontixanthobacter aquaemixtae]MXO90660.1 DUF885 family protein [Pontixanthobacter aquaemixtae]